MTKIKRFLVAAAVAGTTALAPLSAEAFFGMMSAMMHGGGWGGWGGPWGGWGYPYYGYGWGGWGYPHYGWGGWGYPHYGYGGWGYPHYGYGWGYPYAGYPLVATTPLVVAQPATTAAK